MKVLFFVHSFPCVSETFVLNQVTGMIDLGHDVKIYAWGESDSCVHEDYARYSLESRIWRPCRKIPATRFTRIIKISPFFLGLLFKYGLRTFSLISGKFGCMARNLVMTYTAERIEKEKWKPDVIISHFGDIGLFITAMREAGIISRRTRCYTFFHAHEICRLNQKEITANYGPMFNATDVLLPISNFWRNKLIKAGALPNKTAVFHMGINPARFHFREPVKKTQEITILSVGRLVGQKGYEYALKGVASYIRQSSYKIKYIIIGKGDLEYSLKQLAIQYGITENVEFRNAQSQDKVAATMTQADIFLLPSVTDNMGYMEGIPVALMEAMAMGLICISTRHSGIPELIENEVTGFLCEEKNSDDITNALLRIETSDISLLRQISHAAKTKVLEDFNIEKLLYNLDHLISDD